MTIIILLALTFMLFLQVGQTLHIEDKNGFSKGEYVYFTIFTILAAASISAGFLYLGIHL